MTTFTCHQCRKPFRRRQRKDRQNKYCSSSCCALSKIGKPTWNKGLPAPWAIGNHYAKGNSWNKGRIMSEKTKKKLSKIFKGIHRSPKFEFKKGQTSPRKGTGNQWLKTEKGYIKLHLPEHPRADVKGYVFQHIIVAEKTLNRSIPKGEVLHHINGIKDDNRPENLYLFPCNSEHICHCKKNKILISNL